MSLNTSEPAGALTILGDVGVDHVLGPVDGWPAIGTEVIAPLNELRAGGSGGNSALAMRALGRPCRLISLVGDDFFGRWLATQFGGIDAPLPAIAAPTSMSICILHSEGDRSIFTTQGHLEQAEAAALLSQLAPAASGAMLLLSGSFIMPRVSGAYARIIDVARRRGYAIALDTGWPPQGWDAVRAQVSEWLAVTDHALLNDAEVKGFAGTDDLDAAVAHVGSVMAPGATLVVKLGAAGALAIRDGEHHHSPGLRIDAFDTVGAGDAFNAGYLSACLDGCGLHDALAAGCRSAGAIIARFPRGSIQHAEFAVPNPTAADRKGLPCTTTAASTCS